MLSSERLATLRHSWDLGQGSRVVTDRRLWSQETPFTKFLGNFCSAVRSFILTIWPVPITKVSYCARRDQTGLQTNFHSIIYKNNRCLCLGGDARTGHHRKLVSQTLYDFQSFKLHINLIALLIERLFHWEYHFVGEQEFQTTIFSGATGSFC